MICTVLVDRSNSTNMTECLSEGSSLAAGKAIDIERITYSNNGNTLRVTLLPQDFSESPTEFVPTYGFALDVDPSNANGVDYITQVEWDNVTKNWWQIYSETPFRDFLPQRNVTGFYQNGKNYVDISLDLDSIILPEQ